MKAEQHQSDFIARCLEDFYLDSLMKRIWTLLRETLKPKNFPFVLLLVLSVVSLICRIWLTWH
jgi:hypothetical protein